MPVVVTYDRKTQDGESLRAVFNTVEEALAQSCHDISLYGVPVATEVVTEEYLAMLRKTNAPQLRKIHAGRRNVPVAIHEYHDRDDKTLMPVCGKTLVEPAELVGFVESEKAALLACDEKIAKARAELEDDRVRRARGLGSRKR